MEGNRLLYIGVLVPLKPMCDTSDYKVFASVDGLRWIFRGLEFEPRTLMELSGPFTIVMHRLFVASVQLAELPAIWVLPC